MTERIQQRGVEPRGAEHSPCLSYTLAALLCSWGAQWTPLGSSQAAYGNNSSGKHNRSSWAFTVYQAPCEALRVHQSLNPHHDPGSRLSLLPLHKMMK